MIKIILGLIISLIICIVFFILENKTLFCLISTGLITILTLILLSLPIKPNTPLIFGSGPSNFLPYKKDQLIKSQIKINLPLISSESRIPFRTHLTSQEYNKFFDLIGEAREYFYYRTFPEISHYSKYSLTLNPLKNLPELPIYHILTLEDLPDIWKYRKTNNEFKKCIHWGQLKLFLTEIHFLTLSCQKFGSNKKVFIYAGAAPGDHSVLLHKMFPDITFILVDPAPFNHTVITYSKSVSNFKIISGIDGQGFFTNKLAEYLKNKFHNSTILFTSDIRLNNPDEIDVQQDQIRQFNWIKILEPNISMVKFRLPYGELIPKGISKYPKGTIFIQPFPGVSSTETRFILYKEDINTISEYSDEQYERTLFKHNINRSQYKYYIPEKYEYNLLTDGFCNCYDCCLMQQIISDYMKLINLEVTRDSLKDYITKIISQTSTTGKNLIELTKNNFKIQLNENKNYCKPNGPKNMDKYIIKSLSDANKPQRETQEKLTVEEIIYPEWEEMLK